MLYYVETDGRIYLVDRGGTLDLPTPDEVPFPVTPIAPLFDAPETWFCVPELAVHPTEWIGKDDVPGLSRASTAVRAAVHSTMPRVVVEGIALRGGSILIVKGNRGLTRDRWSLPGGFLRFGESPVEGVRRELTEEAGVDGEVGELLAVRAKLGRQTRLHWIMFFYRIDARGEPRANPDEISECRFVPLQDALELLHDSEMRDVVRSLTPTD